MQCMIGSVWRHWIGFTLLRHIRNYRDIIIIIIKTGKTVAVEEDIRSRSNRFNSDDLDRSSNPDLWFCLRSYLHSCTDSLLTHEQSDNVAKSVEHIAVGQTEKNNVLF